MAKYFFDKLFCLEVWGDYACFTRPEMKVERVSYDVITPSAARAIFEAILWKPAIKWKIKKIEVLKPIRWISVRRNEVAALANSSSGGIFIDEVNKEGKPKYRQQRAGYFLQDVHYRLYAELAFIPVTQRPTIRKHLSENLIDPDEQFIIDACKETAKTGKDENPGKYNAMFARRAKKGQCFNQPYLGTREFSCHFRLVEKPEDKTATPIEETRDFGFMLYDMDFSDPKDPKPAFFKAHMEKGIIAVPDWESEDVRR